MKKLFYALMMCCALFAYCTLAVAAQEGIKVKYQDLNI